MDASARTIRRQFQLHVATVVLLSVSAVCVGCGSTSNGSDPSDGVELTATTTLPAVTVSTVVAVGAGDLLTIHDEQLATRVSGGRATYTETAIPVGGGMLTPTNTRPSMSVDDAYRATESAAIVSSYFGGSGSFTVVLGSFDGSLVYDFIVRDVTCVVSPATTAPPRVSTPEVPCTVHVLVDATTGTLVLRSDMLA